MREASRVVGDDPSVPSPGGLRFLPVLYFAGIHVVCLAAIWTGVSWTAAAVCVGFYAVRMFALTAGYHRHLAHRSYSTSRPFRFVLAAIGTLAVQKGPLWWASTHREHHRVSDRPEDPHSPKYRGFWWAHLGWILARLHTKTDLRRVPDLARYPELRWLDRLHFVPPLAVAALLFLVGARLGATHPGLRTTGLQMLVWGFAISTVLLYHGTWSVNSVVHKWGRRRFETSDDSRNNVWVALATGGEGWHNNHHRFPSSERQGFYWWEIDVTHSVVSLLALLGFVWNVKRPPARLLAEGRRKRLAPARCSSRWSPAPACALVPAKR